MKGRGKLLAEALVEFDPDYDQPKNPYHCPISHALDEDPDISRPYTTYDWISFTRPSEQKRYYVRTPSNARRFMRLLHRYIDKLIRRRPSMFRLRLYESDIIKWVWSRPVPGIPQVLAVGPPIIRKKVSRTVRIVP